MSAFLSDLFASPISLTIFISLTLLFIVDLILYTKIYRNLEFLHLEIEQGNAKIEPIKSVVKNYQKLTENNLKKIDTNSYLKAYFSDYQINLSAPYDCQAQNESGIRINIIDSLKFINHSIALFILVGVLGTFLGLYNSLAALSVTEINLTEFAQVISGIQIAFNTSIVGMIYAIIIKFFIKLFNAQSCLEKIFVKLKDYLANDLAREESEYKLLVENICGIKEFLEKIYNSTTGFKNLAKEFKASQKYMEQFKVALAEGVEDFSEIDKNLKTIYQSSQDFITGFQTGINNLNKNFATSFQLWQEVNQRQQEYNQSFKQQLKQQDEYNQFLAKQLKLLAENLANVDDYLVDFKQELKGLTSEINNIIKTENQKQIAALSDIKDDFKGYLNQSGKQLQKQTKVIKEFSNKQSNLISACEDINQYNNKLVYKLNNISKSFSGDLDSKLEKFAKVLNELENNYDDSLKEVSTEFKEHIELSNKLITDKFKNIDNLLAGFLTDIDFNVENLEDTIKNIDRNIFNLAETIKQYNKQIQSLTEAIEQLKQTDGRREL